MGRHRYDGLAAVGFGVMDSCHPDADLQHYLIERAGGHCVDMGDGVRLLAEGQVAVRAGVAPAAFTETGLRFSDGTTADADAVVWCTGFADHNVRATAGEALGLDRDLARCLDGTWGVDAEGEIRGMWKRHLRLDNYWVMGGNMGQQRWWSRILALQIKAALEDTLPPAYRETPVVE